MRQLGFWPFLGKWKIISQVLNFLVNTTSSINYLWIIFQNLASFIEILAISNTNKTIYNAGCVSWDSGLFRENKNYFPKFVKFFLKKENIK